MTLYFYLYLYQMPETILSIFLGVGLSAACGFRIFIPLLVLSAASLSGNLTLSSEFDWISTYPALTVFTIATLIEVLAYLFPWVDNFLDSITTPAAVVAGTVVTASVITDMSPLMKWSLAIIAGGGVAGTVQTFTGLSRITSTTFTGGFANPALSTAEAGSAVGMSLLSISFPIIAFIIVLLLISYSGKVVYKKLIANKLVKVQEE